MKWSAQSFARALDWLSISKLPNKHSAVAVYTAKQMHWRTILIDVEAQKLVKGYLMYAYVRYDL